MTKHAKTLRFYARLLRVAAVVMIVLAVWNVIYRMSFYLQYTGNDTYIPETFTNPTTYMVFLSGFVDALILWGLAVGLDAIRSIVMVEQSKRQAEEQQPRQLTDEERFGLPKPRRARPPQMYEDQAPAAPAPPPRRSARPPVEDEQFTPQRPQPQKAKVDSNQPPRQKLEKKPRLTPRLYNIRWHGGKPQRAVRKTVIE